MSSWIIFINYSKKHDFVQRFDQILHLNFHWYTFKNAYLKNVPSTCFSHYSGMYQYQPCNQVSPDNLLLTHSKMLSFLQYV